MNPQVETPPASPEFPPRKPLTRKASLVGAVVAAVLLSALGGLAWYLTHRSDATPGPGGPGGGRGPAVSTVGVATAERASVPVVLDALGTVTPQATVKVRPQVSGVLEKVLFKEGQLVRAGDLLATIDPRQFEMALMQASGQRQRDEAQLDSAKVTLQRYKTLLEQDSIARQDVDTQSALVKQLEASVVIDRAQEGTARLNLGYTRVVAPIGGRVGLRTVDVGNVVSSADANGLVLITQLTPIDVVFAVPQDRVGELQKSTPVGGKSDRAGGIAKAGKARLAAAGNAMQVTALDRPRASVLDTGVFASLDNQVDTQTGTVKAKASFANRELALFPSQFVNIRLVVRTLENAVLVPVTAVRQSGAGDYVYVLSADRTVSLRSVTRGQASAEKIVIAAGLQAGERVITEGADRLKDGARVALAGDQPRAPGSGGAGMKGKRQRPDGAPAQAASAPEAPSADASSPQRRRRASQAEGS